MLEGGVQHRRSWRSRLQESRGPEPPGGGDCREWSGLIESPDPLRGVGLQTHSDDEGILEDPRPEPADHRPAIARRDPGTGSRSRRRAREARRLPTGMARMDPRLARVAGFPLHDEDGPSPHLGLLVLWLSTRMDPRLASG